MTHKHKHKTQIPNPQSRTVHHRRTTNSKSEHRSRFPGFTRRVNFKARPSDPFPNASPRDGANPDNRIVASNPAANEVLEARLGKTAAVGGGKIELKSVFPSKVRGQLQAGPALIGPVWKNQNKTFDRVTAGICQGFV